ncbi:MAG: diaminopimelate epimerase [Thiotrichaceae bacterium]|nr:diaminopimelate epimerase [Thiotrichaceae bacterium]
MQLSFTKMHGLGNDFIMIDGINQTLDLSHRDIQYLANRHFGVGCDQVLLVEAADSEDVDFRYRIFNSDGTEVEQCGNGARCFARFVREKGLTDQSTIAVNTQGGRIILQVIDESQVCVDMGMPIFQPNLIPIVSPKQKTVYNLDVVTDGKKQSIAFSSVSMGNPHAIVVVDDIDTVNVSEIGQGLASQSFFPEGVNVGFMQVINSQQIRLRVFERGVGETLACGSGACAAVAVGNMLGLLATKVEVSLSGGKLAIQWDGGEQAVLMTGSTEIVFEGVINL